MKTKISREFPELEDALYALALEKERLDAAHLDELVRQYPQYATELTDAAIELVLDALEGEHGESSLEQVDSTSEAVSRAMSRFQNRLHREQTAKQTREAE